MLAGSFVEKILFSINRKFGHLVPYRLRDWLYRKLYPPHSAKAKMLVVDILGSCNLRCPSCPVGNMGAINPTGLMDKGLFEKIVHKARREHGTCIVALYNWTEPLLHPQLPEFIRIAKKQGLVCLLSSNLNVLRNIDEVLKAGPDVFRVSLSGFSQDTYGTTHAGGNIERVKKNMRTLSEASRRVGKGRTSICVYYHKYLHNLHEADQMHAYAQELGFEWLENWAYYMPLEKVLQLVEGQLTAEEADFVDSRFALPIRAAVAEAKKLKGYNRCTLLEDQIVLDHRGNVNLCCAVYDFKANRLGSFLDMSEADLDKAKSGHPTCTRCTDHNLHLYNQYQTLPELKQTYDRLVEANIREKNGTRPVVELPLVTCER